MMIGNISSAAKKANISYPRGMEKYLAAAFGCDRPMRKIETEEYRYGPEFYYDERLVFKDGLGNMVCLFMNGYNSDMSLSVWLSKDEEELYKEHYEVCLDMNLFLQTTMTIN